MRVTECTQPGSQEKLRSRGHYEEQTSHAYEYSTAHQYDVQYFIREYARVHTEPVQFALEKSAPRANLYFQVVYAVGERLQLPGPGLFSVLNALVWYPCSTVT